MGNGSVIRRADVQRMNAGKGVLHSEFNPSPTDPVHLLQIWIEPNVTGIRPSYEEKHVGDREKQGRLRLVASPDERDGSVSIHQDADVYATLLDAGDAVRHRLAPGRKAYVHVARGAVEVNGMRLTGGDGAKISAESEITFANAQGAEVLLFDLAHAMT